MILVIDTTDKECEVAIYDGRNLGSKKWSWAQRAPLRGQKDTGTEVLRNIGKLLKKRPPWLGETGQKNLKEIKAIAVNQGPGSYTGTRVGITIANALGWSLAIPVVGYSKQKSADIARAIYRKLKTGQIPPDHFPTPRY